jgi:hypothetical protein
LLLHVAALAFLRAAATLDTGAGFFLGMHGSGLTLAEKASDMDLAITDDDNKPGQQTWLELDRTRLISRCGDGDGDGDWRVGGRVGFHLALCLVK